MKRKTLKRALSIILVIGVLMSFFAVYASAAGDTFSTATSISLGSTYNGSITNSNEKDFYKFSISESGRITIKLNAYISSFYYKIYDGNGTSVYNSYLQGWDSTTQQYVKDLVFDLTSGTYVFCMIRCGSETGNYNFKILYTSANESFWETYGGNNNSLTSASQISLNTMYYGQIASNDDCDFYKFTITSSEKVHIYLTAYIEYFYFSIYNSSGKSIYDTTFQSWDNLTQYYYRDIELDLQSGNYYFCMSVGKTGNYNFSVGATPPTSSYTVTYNANGGSVSPNSATVSSGNSVTLPTPTKSYTISYNANGGSGAPSSQSVSISCKGWATNSSASSASYSCGSSYRPTSNITIYAVWNSSASTTLSSSKPTRSGYNFLGWSTSSSASSASYSAGQSVSLSGNVTLYAVWEKTSTTPDPTPVPDNPSGLNALFSWVNSWATGNPFMMIVGYVIVVPLGIITSPIWVWFA